MTALTGVSAEVVFDARQLPFAGRIGRTLERLEALPAGHHLRQIDVTVSWPLLAMLTARGHRYRIADRKEGAAHLLIWPHAR